MPVEQQGKGEQLQQQGTPAAQKSDQEQGQDKRKVELDEDVYEALLNKLDELEQSLADKGKGGDDAGDDDEDDSGDDGIDDDDDATTRLAKEAQGQKRRGKKDQELLNIDQLSPSQLIPLIERSVGEKMFRPLLERLEVMRLRSEIDMITRPKEMGGQGVVDFWDYEKSIEKIAKKNPALSLKECYDLAKANSPKPKKDESEDDEKKRKDRDGLLRHLPRTVAHGERPGGPTPSTVKESDPKTLKDAASRAYDEVLEGAEKP